MSWSRVVRNAPSGPMRSRSRADSTSAADTGPAKRTSERTGTPSARSIRWSASRYRRAYWPYSDSAVNRIG